MHDRESPTFPASAIATYGQHSSRYHLCLLSFNSSETVSIANVS